MHFLIKIFNFLIESFLILKVSITIPSIVYQLYGYYWVCTNNSEVRNEVILLRLFYIYNLGLFILSYLD